MNTTTHYGLKQPEDNDNVLIGDLNDNAAAIDTALHDLEQGKAAGTALSAHIADKDNPHEVDPEQIGAIPETEKGAAGGVATLGSDGKVPTGQLPAMNYDPAGSAAAVQQALNSHIADKDNPHEVDPEQIGAATRAEGTISLPSTGWTDDTANSGYWYRSVTVSGMLSTDEPHVGLVKSFTDADADDAMQEAWDLIKGAESLSGSLRFYALEVPEVAVSLQWEVIR